MITKSLPNYLTVLRILIIPCFLVMIFYHEPLNRVVFFLLFVIASISDFFDGYLARKYNLVSDFGKIFDPIADKALVIIVSIIIVVVNKNMVNYLIFPVIILVFREILISGLRENVAAYNIKIKVSNLGKYKTTFQMIALLLLLLSGQENIFFVLCSVLGTIFLWSSVIISILSAYYYVKNLLVKFFLRN